MSETYDACVIGSGPAGWAAAHALLRKGQSVIMLDVGNEASKTTRVLAGPVVSTKGVARKLSFGSDYPYLRPTLFPDLFATNSGLDPSFALGGFSTVWGCAVLPYRDEDLDGWPIRLADLAPHYHNILTEASLIAERDSLGTEFPLYSENPQSIARSSQARTILSAIKKNQITLSEVGVRGGAARILFNIEAPACTLCGLCLNGCPTNTLFTSASLLKGLKSSELFSYRKFYATKFIESERDVTVEGHNVTGAGEVVDDIDVIKARRLFMAGGILPTAVLTLRSTGTTNISLSLCDSQYFLQPVFILFGCFDVLREKLMTVAQLFIEMKNSYVDKSNVHLQVYTYSSLIEEAVQSKMPFPLRWIPRFLRSLAIGRLAVIQGYLHSSSSSKLTLRVADDGVYLIGTTESRAKETAVRAVRLLRKCSGKIGLFPIPGLLEVCAPGRGFHTGGSFPMRENPEAAESDRWGRPFGLRRVHAVDASVFPTVPAATITLTVMANAHRIASKDYEN